jgi:DNA-directed RNA polymerase subunit beta'
MRTFHIGGVAGADITQGLPRVDEIFEVRTPKTKAVIAEFNGVIHEVENTKKQKIIKVAKVDVGKNAKIKDSDIKKYTIPAVMNVKVEEGDLVTIGQVLSEGHIDLKKLFKISGREAIQRYIIKEVQEIYQTQGEGINDKHIEIIIRQMISRVRVISPGDTTLLNGDIVEYERFVEVNEKAAKAGKEEAKGERMILGISKVALSTDSFLSAASFQETAKVLIDAATQGKVDNLKGLKENVIIGRLIPAGTGYQADEAEAGNVEGEEMARVAEEKK